MIVVFTKFPIKAEHFEEYKAYIKGAVDKHNIKKQKGFVDMRLLAPQNLPMIEENSQFIIESIWEDIKSFTDYTQSEAFKKTHENMPPHDWFAGRPEVKVYETIE